MNNNRNNRRRGRGNRSQNGGGNQLNRIDSRARGNAPQLLDKYKKLAQDAQHNGDRVQAEYYLQFADHYFRVIADNKARQEEARGGKRGDGRSDARDQAYDESDDGEDIDNRRSDNRPENRNDNRSDARKPARRSRNRRDDDDLVDFEGEEGHEGEPFDPGEAQANGYDEDEAEARSPRGSADADGDADAQPKPRRRRAAATDEKRPARTRKPRAKKPVDDGPAAIDSAVLPPAIGGGATSASDDGDALEAVG